MSTVWFGLAALLGAAALAGVRERQVQPIRLRVRRSRPSVPRS